MRIDQAYVDSKVPLLNKLIVAYETEFGKSGFKKIPKGRVRLIKKSEIPSGASKKAIAFGDRNFIYVVEDRFPAYLSRLEDYAGARSELKKAIGDIAEYSMLNLLCHEETHLSCRERWLDDDTGRFYSNGFYYFVYGGDKRNKRRFNFLLSKECRVKSIGMRLAFFEGDEERESTHEALDEYTVNALTGRIMGLYLMSSGKIGKYIIAQFPNIILSAVNSDGVRLANIVRIMNDEESLVSFTRDFLSGNVAERVKETLIAAPEDEEAFQASLTYISGSSKGFKGFYRRLYGSKF